MMHPGGTICVSLRKAAAGEYAEELQRTERKLTPVLRMVYMGLPSRKRKALMEHWRIAFPPARRPQWIGGPPRHRGPKNPRSTNDGQRGGLLKHPSQSHTRERRYPPSEQDVYSGLLAHSGRNNSGREQERKDHHHHRRHRNALMTDLKMGGIPATPASARAPSRIVRRGRRPARP